MPSASVLFKLAAVLLTAVVARSQPEHGALVVQGEQVHLRQLLAAPAVTTIYNNADLQWRSWSWGLAALSVADAAAPMPGARAALCLSIQPFGALSLKSAMPFPLDGVLGFYIRGSSNTTAEQLGSLQLQFESSSPSRYTITPTMKLAAVLEAQATADGGTAAAMLAGIAAGQWTPVKVAMQSFAPAAPAQGSDSGAAFKADRLTMGSCLQQLQGCSDATPNLDFCLDKLVIVSAA